MKNFGIVTSKLVGVTTNGAPLMVGKNNKFVKWFLDVIWSEGVLVSHCIIHQKNLCLKVLDFGKIMKNAVSCVNYIRSWGLNHWHFKSFLQALNSDYPAVNYFCAVRWLRRAATLRKFEISKRLFKLLWKVKIKLFLFSKIIHDWTILLFQSTLPIIFQNWM